MAKKVQKETAVKLFLCGDVMTGRGIDQALPHSVNPELYESYIKNAENYLKLAERENGEIDTPISYDYIWGDALEVWERENPDFRILNLETSITTQEEPWPGKGINYRMHPENVKIFETAGIDYCSLANNHTLDWKRPGLGETMNTLQDAGIKFSGVGRNLREAKEPSILSTGKGRVLVFSYGSPTSGIPYDWSALSDRSGVNLLPMMNDTELEKIRQEIQQVKQENDIVIFSVHWGGNWGYDIPHNQRDFAHQLIEEAGVDVVYGHSSHHPMGIEVFRDKLIIYGAGDFVNDYEGIGGHERFRGELSLMYFPILDLKTGNLTSLKMVPMEIKKLKLHHVSAADATWLQEMLSREGEELGTIAKRDNENNIWLEW